MINTYNEAEACKFCKGREVVYSDLVSDGRCQECGKWQEVHDGS